MNCLSSISISTSFASTFKYFLLNSIFVEVLVNTNLTLVLAWLYPTKYLFPHASCLIKSNMLDFRGHDTKGWEKGIIAPLSVTHDSRGSWRGGMTHVLTPRVGAPLGTLPPIVISHSIRPDPITLHTSRLPPHPWVDATPPGRLSGSAAGSHTRPGCHGLGGRGHSGPRGGNNSNFYFWKYIIWYWVLIDQSPRNRVAKKWSHYLQQEKSYVPLCMGNFDWIAPETPGSGLWNVIKGKII